MRALLLALSLCLISADAVAQAVDVPPVARVTDLTGTLAGAQQQALSQKLAAFEQAKGSQIAVLVVPSTQPETIEQYAIRVAEQWKLGRQGVDDGLLLLVALQDRAVRIEVGYGLEGAIPDAIAKRIVEETILPRFREGDVSGGIAAGVDQIIAVIDGEPLPPAASRAASPADALGSLFPVLFAVVLGVGQLLRRALGPAPAGLLLGGGAFLLIWLVVGTMVVAAIAGIVVFFLTLVGLGHGGMMGGGGRGGLGGGGFGGGGGGFGGGGASGRW